MKICLMCEGSYPYVTGGVSSWVHMLMTSLTRYDFCISAITVDRESGGKFKYEMPPNMSGIYEIYLQDLDYVRFPKRPNLTKRQIEAFRSFFLGTDIDWETIFDYFANYDVSVNSLLMGSDVYDMILEYYKKHYARLPFADFLWTYRSMMLPICTLLKNKLPEADIYHSASTGYSGVLACFGKYLYKKPAIITEHGIYTREREEDIIRSQDFSGPYKDLWIEHFYKLSSCAYQYADKVIALFDNARTLQQELGCDPAKTSVVPNGVDPQRFDNLQGKDHDQVINLGIIARIAPIKDIKTLINAYAAAKLKVPNLNLYIMGGVEADFEAYSDECEDLVRSLGLPDIYFTGNINILEYIGKMDMIILTSISEGQPISILEAMAAKRACITTSVGDCKGLLLGNHEGDKPCGIVTPIMSVSEISEAIVELAFDADKRKEFGETGRKRVEEYYQKDMVISTYDRLYKEVYYKV